jgi:hypothetical protein
MTTRTSAPSTTSPASRPAPKKRASRRECRDELWRHFEHRGLPTSVAVLLEPFFGKEPAATIAAFADEITEYLESRRGAPHAINLFLSVADDITERRDRYAALRALELLIGSKAAPLARPVWLGVPNERRRPLTAIEMGVVRLAARRTVRRTLPVALLEAGAASGEVGQCFAADVACDPFGSATLLNAPGSLRTLGSGYPPCHPRLLTIPAWAAKTVGKVAAALPGDAPVAYLGEATDPAAAQSAVLMNVRNTLNIAGFATDTTVTPLSIRNGAARAAYERDGIQAAFAMLGHDDMNHMAREIGLRPQLPRP